jgi:hypothetical protein
VWNWDAHPTYVNCVFTGNRAWENGGAMRNSDSSWYTLVNCTLCDNVAGQQGGAIDSDEWPILVNCILWANRDSSGMGESAHVRGHYQQPSFNYCCVQGWTGAFGGSGNIGADPCFASPANGDYHLESQAGRWDADSQTWIQDEVTSPCIDAGDMKSPIGLEPFPNGGRINMGAYGGTAEASKSYFGAPVCRTIVAGDINGDCTVDSLDFAIMAYHWLEEGDYE